MSCELGHALARRGAARQHLQGQQHQHQQHAELRHAARQRGHEDAHRGGGEQVQGRAGQEQATDPSIGTCSSPRTMNVNDSAADASTTSPIDHTLATMISVGVTGMTSRCSMVPCSLADQRGAGQDDGQHGDVVDDLHQRAEPGLGQVGVEAHAYRQAHRRLGAGAVAACELVDLVGDDLLDVVAAGEGLAHAGGVHIELDLRRPASTSRWKSGGMFSAKV